MSKVFFFHSQGLNSDFVMTTSSSSEEASTGGLSFGTPYFLSSVRILLFSSDDGCGEISF